MSAEQHKKVCEELTEIYEKKNADYGNSFELSYEKFGLLSAVIRISDKVNRLENLLLNEKAQQVQDESIQDTLKDLANYTIMTLMQHSKQPEGNCLDRFAIAVKNYFGKDFMQPCPAPGTEDFVQPEQESSVEKYAITQQLKKEILNNLNQDCNEIHQSYLCRLCKEYDVERKDGRFCEETKSDCIEMLKKFFENY